MLPTQILPRLRATSFRSLTTACCAGLLALAMLGLSVPCALADPPKKKVQTYKQSNDVIEAVDTAANTVTIATVVKQVPVHAGSDNPAGDGAHTTSKVTLTISSTTEIEVNGQKSDIKGLQKGMTVSVTKGTDETTASRLVAH